MKSSIIPIISLICCIMIFSLFLKFVIMKWYKKYMIKTTNTSAAIYSFFLTIGFTILIYTFLDPLKDILYVVDKNTGDGYTFAKAFIPLLGQCLLIILVTYTFVTWLAKSLFKFFFNTEGVLESILKESIGELILFGMMHISFIVISSVFIERLVINLTPLSNSIT